jgi:hypothetical protein
LAAIESHPSQRLIELLHDRPHISHVNTLVDKEKREHLLGFMTWDALTKNLKYTDLGAIRSLSDLSKMQMLAACFIENV